MTELYTDLEKNYYLKLTEFANGNLEACLKVVRPMKQEQLEACINGTTYATACAEAGGIAYNRVIRKATEAEQEERRKANIDRSVRRSRQSIRYRAHQMSADRLLTLTVRDNVEDRDYMHKAFTKFLRLVRAGYKERKGHFDYVAVLEKQERGALHIHLAVRGFQPINFLRKCWYKALDGQGNEQGEHTPGAVNVTSADKSKWGHTGRQWKSKKLVGYLCKYLGKTFGAEDKEKRRYWSSADIKVPKSQLLWIAGEDITTAIVSTIRTLKLACGLRSDFTHWLSNSGDTYWIAGSSAS